MLARKSYLQMITEVVGRHPMAA
jgi:hypothetical protein